ncbi:acyltransferase family protein [Haloferula sp. BvORR071]|uniref:acyltransferase family protein n=1 Tax=Haloferula sp. BvORR071 TaxID=1396141 RepID=UPI000552CB4D|nr:acyltransferase family protein [Haloferula sp. BvORR071]
MFSAKTVQLSGPATRQPRASAVVQPQTGVKTGERFVHLDALRAGLMFWGILVHTSNVAPSPFFQACANLSHMVRMEAFFIISGFLAYMLLQKYGSGKTVRKRLVAVGVPFVVALVLLNPSTKHLVYVFNFQPIPFVDYIAGKGSAGLDAVNQARLAGDELAAWPGNWHLHLWFLLALFFYSLLAPLLGKAVDSLMASSLERSPRAWTLGRLAPLVPGLKFMAICLMVCGACVGWRIVFEFCDKFIPQHADRIPDSFRAFVPFTKGIPESLQYVIRSIGNYLPFYTLGMVLFASGQLRAIFSKAHWIQAVVACTGYYLVHRTAGTNPGPAYEALLLTLKTYVALCLSSVLFWAAERWVKSEKPVARFLSEAAYTVYLFHFLVIFLFAILLRGMIPQTEVMLVTIAVLTFATTLGLHAFVIRPVPLLSFLFNGKPPKRAK